MNIGIARNTKFERPENICAETMLKRHDAGREEADRGHPEGDRDRDAEDDEG